MADTATVQKQDNRKPNFQPNHMAPEVIVAVNFDGKTMGELGIQQGSKLSKAGAITYFGGINKGWKLPGDSNVALAALSFSVLGNTTSRSSGGVHANKAGDPCVYHSAVVELVDANSVKHPYMVGITATYVLAKGWYKMQVLLSPASGGGGPIVRGTLSGDFDIEGYEA